MTEPDDIELQRYLSGSDPISGHYRKMADEVPPPELDESIRQQARKALPKRKWLRPAAAAAVIVLSAGVMIEWHGANYVDTTPATNTSGSEETTPQGAVPERSLPQAARESSPGADTLANRNLRSSRQPRRFSKALKSPAIELTAKATAQAQVAHIQALAEAGERKAAVDALKDLLADHPAYPLPRELKQLAVTEGLLKDSDSARE